MLLNHVVTDSKCSTISARRGIAVGCLGGPLYAVGGLDDSTCFDTVERYDIEHNTWSTVAQMSTPRGGVAVAALKVTVSSIDDPRSFINIVPLGLFVRLWWQ